MLIEVQNLCVGYGKKEVLRNVNLSLNKNEIVMYKNISDLSEKIVKYSNDYKLRNYIAKKGRLKYFKYFNSTIISEFILNKTFEIKKKYYWESIK